MEIGRESPDSAACRLLLEEGVPRIAAGLHALVATVARAMSGRRAPAAGQPPVCAD